MKDDSNNNAIRTPEGMQLGSQFSSQDMFNGQGGNNLDCNDKYQQVNRSIFCMVYYLTF